MHCGQANPHLDLHLAQLITEPTHPHPVPSLLDLAITNVSVANVHVSVLPHLIVDYDLRWRLTIRDMARGPKEVKMQIISDHSQDKTTSYKLLHRRHRSGAC